MSLVDRRLIVDVVMVVIPCERDEMKNGESGLLLNAIRLLRFLRVSDCQRIAGLKLFRVDISSVVSRGHITDLEILVRLEVCLYCLGAGIVSAVGWNYCKSHGLGSPGRKWLVS